MNPKEQEIAIGELEERVDRLRNIYEQYFLGFEKLEPTVPRKDVDRRFSILRKEQIRNTAMRFRFQVVTQKYNTYAMHWVRICRQIEEGTYKRHIRKAKARFGDGPTAATERDYAIDVDIDMDDFDASEFDNVLAETNAAAETYERAAPDTLPPPPASARHGQMAVARHMLLTRPGTSFAVGRGTREVLDDAPERNTDTPMPPSFRPNPDRTARGAALPAGARARVLRKRDDAEPPPSAPPSNPHMTAPSTPALPPPPASSPRMPAASSPVFNPAARGSVPRIQQRAPAPGPAAPSGGRLPIAAPLPPPSSPRLPLVAPPPNPSAGRIPVAAPPPKPPPRQPMPSVSDEEGSPPSGESRPSMRPRAPLPLPSQAIRPKKS